MHEISVEVVEIFDSIQSAINIQMDTHAFMTIEIHFIPISRSIAKTEHNISIDARSTAEALEI